MVSAIYTKRRTRAVLFGAACVLINPFQPFAHATSWTFNGSGTWQTATNWNAGIPNSAVDASFVLNNTYTVTSTASAAAQNMNVSAGDVTLAAGASTIQAGTINLSGGSLTVGSLVYGAAAAGQVGFTSALNFTGGTLTINGGVLNPKLQTETTSDGTFLSTYTNSLSITSAPGASTRSILNLSGGGSLSIARGNDAVQDGALIVGVRGGKGGIAVSGSTSSLKVNSFQSPLSVGDGGSVSNSIFTPSDGSLSVSSGANVSATSTFGVGVDGGVGNVLVDGAGSKVTTGAMVVASGTRTPSAAISSVGSLTISNGGLVNPTSYIEVGAFGGVGTMTITGTSSKLTTPQLVVGLAADQSVFPVLGAGTLLMNSGGQAGCAFVGIGQQGGIGNATVDGTNTLLDGTAGGLFVGYNSDSQNKAFAGNGSLLISNGAIGTFGGASYIGYNDGVGTVNVSAAALTVKSTLTIGDTSPDTTSSGTLLVSSAGTVTTSSALIGGSAGVGFAHLSGSGTQWTNTSTLKIANDGTAAGVGTLVLDNNATLTNTGTLSVYTGGKLSVATAALVNTGSLDLSVGGTLAMTGGKILINGGGLYLPAAGMTFGDGSTASTLQLHNATINTGPLTVAAASVFTGAGTAATKLTLNPGATLSPGEGLGKLTAAAGLTLSSSGSVHALLQMEIGAPTTPGSTFDQIAMTGGVFTVGGATLQLVPVAGLQLNHTYPIVVTTSASIDSSTQFSNLAGGTNFNDGHVVYQVSYSASEIDVTFTAVPEPAICSLLLAGLLLRRRRHPEAPSE